MKPCVIYEETDNCDICEKPMRYEKYRISVMKGPDRSDPYFVCSEECGKKVLELEN